MGESDKHAGAFVEQGVQVFKVSDYEFYAGWSQDNALAEAARQWGYDTPEAAIKDDCLCMDDVEPCDLDEHKINLDEGSGTDLITFRESIKRRLAAGETFPSFFAGFDS